MLRPEGGDGAQNFAGKHSPTELQPKSCHQVPFKKGPGWVVAWATGDQVVFKNGRWWERLDRKGQYRAPQVWRMQPPSPAGCLQKLGQGRPQALRPPADLTLPPGSSALLRASALISPVQSQRPRRAPLALQRVLAERSLLHRHHGHPEWRPSCKVTNGNGGP